MKRKLFTLLSLFLFAATAAVAQDKLEMNDKDGNLLMRVNDEGTAGSITLPGLGAVPAVFTDKIYNIGGELYFNGAKLNSPWAMSGANIYFDSGAVGVGTATPNSNAVLDVDAAGNDKGVLLPRLTTAQRTAISGLGASDEGLIVYDETTDGFWFWSGSQWNELGGGAGGDNLGNHTATQALDLSGHDINNGGTVMATTFVGDGSGLTGISGDNLGNHTATQALDLSGHDINNGGTVTATTFVGDGSGLTGIAVSGGDDLGDHTATQSLNLNGNYLSGDGESEGVFVDATGKVSIGTNSATLNGSDYRIYSERQNTDAAAIMGWNDPAMGMLGVSDGNFPDVDLPLVQAVGVLGYAPDVSNLHRAAVVGYANNTAGITYGGMFHAVGDNIHANIALYAEAANSTEGNWVGYFVGERSYFDGRVGIGADPTSELEVNGTVTATAFVGDGSGLTNLSGDDLGNHTAAQTLDLANNDITNGGTVTATAFVGDGSGLTNLSGDDLGNHTAAQTLDLANNDITNGGTVTAAAFVGDGSGLTNISGTDLGNHTATQNIDLNGNWLTNDANFDNGIFLLTNGNVGIGTSNAQAKLDIRPGNDGDPGSDPQELTGLRVDMSSFGGAKTSALFLGGNVGVGTADPLAPLHVNGTTTIASFTGGTNGGAWMKESSGAGTDEIDWANNAGSTPVSIYANGSIVADGEGVFVAATVNWSDERIKQIEGVSDAGQDLTSLDGIEITDYRRIDGGKREKKVIAQQLRKVFPQAVSLREGVIPSIYAHIEQFEFDEANGLLTIDTPAPHQLVAGDQVDYYTEAGKLSKQPVTAVLSEHAFQVEASSEPQEVFVYGKWVSDVHVVDYDAISMLNVSATQELYRVIQQQQKENETQQEELAALKAQIAVLNAQNAELASLNRAFETRFAQIETALRKRSDIELASAEKK